MKLYRTHLILCQIWLITKTWIFFDAKISSRQFDRHNSLGMRTNINVLLHTLRDHNIIFFLVCPIETYVLIAKKKEATSENIYKLLAGRMLNYCARILCVMIGIMLIMIHSFCAKLLVKIYLKKLFVIARARAGKS